MEFFLGTTIHYCIIICNSVNRIIMVYNAHFDVFEIYDGRTRWVISVFSNVEGHLNCKTPFNVMKHLMTPKDHEKLPFINRNYLLVKTCRQSPGSTLLLLLLPACCICRQLRFIRQYRINAYFSLISRWNCSCINLIVHRVN